MAYVRRHWVDYPDTTTPIDADALNNIEDGIEESHNIQLLAVTDTAPSECAEGDKYYDTTTKLIYTATGTDEWGETGETPIADILYIVLEEQSTYTYDGTDLVSVGGSSVVNEYNTGTGVGYSANYINQKTNIITAIRTTDFTITQSDAYVDIPFDDSLVIGTKLSLSNGKVVIGSGVSKVKISSKICLPSSGMTAGSKNLVVRKNGTIVDRTWQYLDVRNSSMMTPVRIIEATEGDSLSLSYYGKANEKIAGTSPFTDFTVEVVE